MAGRRPGQVGGQVREEIMSIIQRSLKDPRIGFVSVTEVQMSPDLRSARVKVSVLGDETAKKETLKGLNSARGLIRRELGRRLSNLRYTPEVRFELDQGLEYSDRISQALSAIFPPDTETEKDS